VSCRDWGRSHIGHARPFDLWTAYDLGNHYAFGHSVWSDVRRINHISSGQYPRGGRLCGNLFRWVSNGSPGESGAGIIDCSRGIFHCRDDWVILLTLMALPLSNFALRFGPPEYFSLMFFALTMLSYLGSSSMAKAFAMAMVGLILGTVE